MAEEAEKTKGGLLKYIMFGLGGIALVGLGLGAGFFVFGSKAADPSEEIEQIVERKMKEAEEAAAAAAAADAGPEKKEAPEEWTVNGRVNFIFNQTSFSNWLAGGENNVAGNIGVNYDFNYRNKKLKWDNKIISSFGITHANKQGFRKTDDRFEYNSILALESIEEWYLSFFSNFISQFSRGFDYSQDPRQEVSSILSPAYFSFGPGILWRKNENLRVNIAPATSRFIFVSKPFSGMYGVPEGKRSIYGIGLNMSAYLKFKLMDNVTVENIIALYSDYIDNPQNIDVNHQANFEVDVNKYLSVNLTLHLKSDTNASSKIQFRQLFGLGVNYTFHKI